MRMNKKVKGELRVTVIFEWPEEISAQGQLRIHCNPDKCQQGCPSKNGFCPIVDKQVEIILKGIEDKYRDAPLSQVEVEQLMISIMPLYVQRATPYLKGNFATLTAKIDKQWKALLTRPMPEIIPEEDFNVSELVDMPIYWSSREWPEDCGYDYATYRDTAYYWQRCVRQMIEASIKLLQDTNPTRYKEYYDGHFIRSVEKQVWRFIKKDYDVYHRAELEKIEEEETTKEIENKINMEGW